MPENPEEPIDVQRLLMDRARQLAARNDEPLERPLVPRLVGLGLALVVVATVLFAFDLFLTAVQRFMNTPVTEPVPAASEPVPAYVVPPEQPPQQPGQ